MIIAGPTASGKTNLALHLASVFGGELVSADSRQIYKGMDIGTGKDVNTSQTLYGSPVKVEVENRTYSIYAYGANDVPLWMYDLVSPDELFNVSYYRLLATRIIEDISSRGNLAIVVGGTGFYIDSLLHARDAYTIPPDDDRRRELESLSLEKLQMLLESESKELWNVLNNSDRQNPRRLIRKIEIGRWKKAHVGNVVVSKPDAYDSFFIGLRMENTLLYQAIDARVERRWRSGILAEIQSLLSKGYQWNSPGLATLGYKEWKPYFEMLNDKCRMLNDQEKKQKIETILAQWKYDEHDYARRQMTWFRKQPAIRWFDPIQDGYLERVTSAVRSWYTKI